MLHSPTFKMLMIALLSALGAILMSFIQLPYPIAPFLRIEFSDVAVLIAFLLFGWKEAVFVGLFKAVLNGMILGPVGPLWIGQISAFLASMAYVSGLFLVLRLSKIKHPIVLALMVVVWVTSLMLAVNYFIVTPVYLQTNFIAIRNSIALRDFLAFIGFDTSLGYLTFTVVLYAPFNFIKGSAIMAVYFVVSRATMSYFSIRPNESL